MHDQPESSERHHRSRVWAEVRADGLALLTWQRAEPVPDGTDATSDARAVAATVGVMAGVSSASTTDGGVLVTYDPDLVTRQQLAGAARAALSLDADLKTRGNEM